MVVYVNDKIYVTVIPTKRSITPIMQGSSSLMTRIKPASIRIGALILAMVTMFAILIAASPPADAASTMEQQFIDLINQERTSRGLSPVKEYWDLTDDARIHSYDMLTDGQIYHTSNLAGVTSSGWEALAENVGAGPTVSSLHTAFMNSSGHRTNILGNYNYVGIGIAKSSNGQLWVTEIFMRNNAISVNPDVDRSSGPNRYETAAAISANMFASASTVYVVTGENYPDALGAGPAAGKKDAPVLYVQKNSIPEATRRELLRLDPSKIVVAGGTAVISSTVFNQLKSYAPTVTRQYGTNRYGTAAALSAGAFSPSSTSVAYVAVGTNYPDALAAGPAAISDNAPLLLTATTYLPSETRTELARLNLSKIVVVGGTGAVNSTVFNQLKAYAPTVTRLAGSSRWNTARLLSEYAFSDASSSIVYIAYGYGWADSVAGTAAASQVNGPLLMVSKTSLPYDTKVALNRLGPERIMIFGGPAVVSTGVETALAPYLN